LGALGEVHDRDRVDVREAVDRAHVRLPDLAQRGRRRDREAAIQQEAHDLALALQPGHIPGHEDAVDRAQLQRHMLGQ
jgi:hypothetical protein